VHPDAQSASALPKPGAVGRTLRLVFGAVLLLLCANLLRQAHEFLAPQAGWRIPGGNWWLGGIVCVLALPTLINGGFKRRWGAWPIFVFVLLAGGAIAWDRLVDHRLWAPPLAWLVLLLLLYVFLHAGISFVVGGIAAVPG
jgi:uncharacterized membrane protein YphA (DoxX/SURF4 family)